MAIVTFTVKNSKFRRSFLKINFEKLKNAILGNKYSLSAVIVGEKLIKSLNRRYRGVDKSTDVLSFPLNTNSGEIFLCPSVAARKAPKFGMTVKKYLLYLVIHAMLHLKGFEHGSKMEATEQKFLKTFSKF